MVICRVSLNDGGLADSGNSVGRINEVIFYVERGYSAAWDGFNYKHLQFNYKFI